MEQAAQQQVRQTAYIVGLDELHSSEYIVSEGEWEPNYLLIRGLKVSRVSVLGVVVAVEGEKTRGFTIDDGRMPIQVRIFEGNVFPAVEIGDIVLVIGRPRVFNDEKYIVPEIVRHVKEEGWIEVRRRQLENHAGTEIIRKKVEHQKVEIKDTVQDKIVEQEVDEEKTGDKSEADILLGLIRKFDFGNGADIEEVIKNSNIEKAEKIIMNLLAEGEIFEVKTGRLKVLE